MSAALHSHLSAQSSSAEQPAEYLGDVRSRVAQPATACREQDFCRLAFYNVGWQSADKKRAVQNLAKLMSTICQKRAVHGFGISEVFNIADDDKHQQRQEIMKLILGELNADSAEHPVWIGKTDVHYIFVWNTNALTCLLYEVISCGIEEQAARKAQYFQFVTALGGETLHVFHNHSPSSDARSLTNGRRKRICSTCWHHVATRTSAAQPAVVFGGDFNCSPLEWGLCLKDLMETQSARRTVQICRSRPMGGHKGDNAIAMNVRAIQETSGFGVSWQSKKEAFTDEHDVVLVPLHWGNRRESKNSAAQPVSQSIHIDAKPTKQEEEVHTRTGNDLTAEQYCQPHGMNPPYAYSDYTQASLGNSPAPAAAVATAYGKQTTPKSSAERPPGLEEGSMASESAAHGNVARPAQDDADQSPDQDLLTTPPPVSDESDDAHFHHQGEPPQILWPDTEEDIMSPALSLSLPSFETPLYNALLDKLSAAGDDEIMESLADLFIYGKLKCKQPCGSAEQPARSSDDPYSLGLRVEHLLNVTLTQRSHQIARLAARNDPRAELADTLLFSPDDMKEVMNAWRQQPQTWMDPTSLTKVMAMTKQQDYHQACKGRFNTMLFELFGNKSLVETLIRISICSAAQPASVLKSFAKAWHNFDDGLQARRARENSQRQVEPRLSKQIHELKMRKDRGRWIAEWVAADWHNWYRLNAADRHLWVEYNSGNMQHKMTELRAKQQPKFPGAAESLTLELQHFAA